LVIASLAAIILPLISSLSNPRALLKSGIGIAALAIIFLIGWSMSTPEINAQFGVTEGASKIIGGSLITMYILFVVAIIGIVASEIYKIVQ
jgi:hypothetical protein